MELFKGMTHTNMVNVSYKGIQQGHTDAISGQIHVKCDVVYTILPHVRSARLRALGVTARKRSPIAPEVNTIGGTAEQFADFLRKEIEKWGKVIKAAGIEPQ